MKSRRDGSLLQMFQIELMDPAKAEAIISNNLTCPQTGIILGQKSLKLEFQSSSVITAKISDTQPKIVRLKLNVSSVENATHTKAAQIEKRSNQSVPTVKDHMLLTIKGVQLIKNRCSINMWWTTKKVMPPF